MYSIPFDPFIFSCGWVVAGSVIWSSCFSRRAVCVLFFVSVLGVFCVGCVLDVRFFSVGSVLLYLVTLVVSGWVLCTLC